MENLTDILIKNDQPYSLKRKKLIVKILTPPFNLDHPIVWTNDNDE